MRSHILKTILVLLVLLLVFRVVILFYDRPSPGITLENAERIRVGMSEKEVEEILGEEGKRGLRPHLGNPQDWNGGAWGGNNKAWVAKDGGVIWVGLENDKVIWAETNLSPSNKGFFKTIKEWLGF
jgi:hypothetical protein